jgi:hypothetical protein
MANYDMGGRLRSCSIPYTKQLDLETFYAPPPRNPHEGLSLAGRNRAIMDGLTLFGLIAVSAMLATYALEERSSWFILGFALACCLGSIYGFLQGAWPFGLVEAIWSLVALRRWRVFRRKERWIGPIR